MNACLKFSSACIMYAICTYGSLAFDLYLCLTPKPQTFIPKPYTLVPHPYTLYLLTNHASLHGFVPVSTLPVRAYGSESYPKPYKTPTPKLLELF